MACADVLQSSLGTKDWLLVDIHMKLDPDRNARRQVPLGGRRHLKANAKKLVTSKCYTTFCSPRDVKL